MWAQNGHTFLILIYVQQLAVRSFLFLMDDSKKQCSQKKCVVFLSVTAELSFVYNINILLYPFILGNCVIVLVSLEVEYGPVCHLVVFLLLHQIAVGMPKPGNTRNFLNKMCFFMIFIFKQLDNCICCLVLKCEMIV